MKTFNKLNTFNKSGAAGTLYHIFLFAFTLACGWLVSSLLDSAMESGGEAALKTALILAAVLLIGLPVIFILRRGLGRLMRADRQSFREKLYSDIIERRISVDSTGELDVKLSNDADTVAEYYQTALPTAIEGALTMLGSAVLLCLSHLWLGLILFGLSLVQLLPTVVYEKWAKDIYEQTDYAEEVYDGWLIQGCDGLSTLKSYKRENWFIQKLEGISDGMVRAGVRAEQAGTVETVVFQFVDGILRYGSYVIMGLFVLYGGLRVADTPVLIVLSGYLFGSVNYILEAMQKRFEYSVAKKQLAGSAVADPEKPQGALLELSGVCKTYDDKQVLKDISLTVNSGERVLVCGQNGSGKSTLLKIALGFVSADKGDIRIDTDITAFALQEEADLTLSGAELLDDLIKENAVDGEAARRHLAGFDITAEILEKPLSEWSMGQRKKFYLASAFAKPAELLVLDEPTNHLDSAALDYLYNLISAYKGAVLAVSHQSDMPVKWDKTLMLG